MKQFHTKEMKHKVLHKIKRPTALSINDNHSFIHPSINPFIHSGVDQSGEHAPSSRAQKSRYSPVLHRGWWTSSEEEVKRSPAGVWLWLRRRWNGVWRAAVLQSRAQHQYWLMSPAAVGCSLRSLWKAVSPRTQVPDLPGNLCTLWKTV